MDNPKRGRPIKWTASRLKKLGEELCTFAKEDGVWHISKFEEEKGLYPKCLYNLASYHPKEFEHYIHRANRIIGNKMLEQAMAKGADRWVLKTFLPRMLDVRHWIKEDLNDEATAKAEAIKTVNSQEPTHPFFDTLNQYIEKESSRQNTTKS